MNKSVKNYFLLIVIGLLLFWPISFFVFGLKNDVLSDYFPTRFFISESLHSGFFPWWNPYVNFGIPQYAEMNSSFWSPITWCIAALPGYNMFTIQMEVVFYILLGGLGMYRLGKVFAWNNYIRWIAAVSYMGSGFFTSHIQHLNWLSAAAFLPWCICFLIEMTRNSSWKNSLLAALFFYLFVASTHPGLFIGGFYFFGIVWVVELYKRYKTHNANLSKPYLQYLLFACVLCLLLAGELYSYTESLPYITHSQHPDLNVSTNTTTVQSWTSLLLPAATNKNSAFFISDISLRNSYLGILTWVFLVVGFCKNYRKNLLWMVLGVFFMFLSSDLPGVVSLKQMIPFISYVRLSGSFRLFAIMPFLIIAFNTLQDYWNQKDAYVSWTKKVFFITSFVLIAILGVSIYEGFQSREWEFFLKNGFLLSSKAGIKSILDNIGFYSLMAVSAMSSFIFLAGTYWALQKQNLKYLFWVVCLDMFVSVNLKLPFTGVGQNTPQQLQSMVDTSPKGIPIPKLQALKYNDMGTQFVTKTIGHWSYYNKQPGTLERASQPIIFLSEFEIFSDSSLKYLAQKPFIYFEENGQNSSAVLQIHHFDPNRIQIELGHHPDGVLTVLYKKYLHGNIYVDHKKVSSDDPKQVFYQIPISAAQHSLIEFKFQPTIVIFLFGLTVVTLILTLSGIVFFSIREQ